MRVTIRIRSDGTIEAETHDVEGPGCLGAIPVVEDLCGAEVTDSYFKPEFHATGQQQPAAEHEVVRQEESL